MVDATGIAASSQINYKGAKTVKTPLGGCLTILAGVLLLTIAVVMFSQLLGPTKFVQSIEFDYLSSENPMPFFINANQAIPAIRIRTGITGLNVT